MKIFPLAAALLAAAPALAQDSPSQPQERYTAQLSPVNPDLTQRPPSGAFEAVRVGDSLILTLDASGLPPGMRLAHLHGLVDGGEAACPGPEADANGDGILDLLEAVEVAGQTLIPLHQTPETLDILSGGYSEADQSGRLRYSHSAPLGLLQAQLLQRHRMENPDYGAMTVMIHGVPEGTNLPDSARSLPGVPATSTIPIACGALERTN